MFIRGIICRMNHSDAEVNFSVAAMRLSCAVLLNREGSCSWLSPNYPLQTALQVIFQRIVGNGGQSPVKAAGSKSIQGRPQVPAKILCWFAKDESAAADTRPGLPRACPRSAAASSLTENISWSYLSRQVLAQPLGRKEGCFTACCLDGALRILADLV